MCGIVGQLVRRLETAQEGARRRELASAMIGTIHHRGPDGVRIFHDGRCSLAFSQLALFRTNSQQPLTHPRRAIHVVCNGEIYNHTALRRNVLRDRVFSSRSDCEVLLHLYDIYGAQFVHHMEGQFAFLLWDADRGLLIAGRDRFGICPLFYFMDQNRVFFASEAKSLFQDASVTRELDSVGLAETALFYAPSLPRTCFRGINQLPNAHVLTVDWARWQTKLESYWSPPFLKNAPSVKRNNIAEIANDLRETIESSVRRCARHGDESSGLCISGGIDSSLIAAVAKRQSAKNCNSFSIRFPDLRFDETEFQELLVREHNLTHHSLLCNDSMIATALPRVVWHGECPLFRTAPIPLFYLAKLIQQCGIKTVLSGQGSDEIFCGYPIFLEGELRRLVGGASTFREAKENAQQLFSRKISSEELTSLRSRYSSSRGRFAQFPSHSARWTSTSRILGIFHKRIRERFNVKTACSRLRHLVQSTGGTDLTPLAWSQSVEMSTKLTGYLLAAQGDRVFMSHGVEVRYPFLDENVVSSGLQISEALRMNAKFDKYVLRVAAKPILSKALRLRPKKGYLAPDRSPFFGPASADYVNELLRPSRLRSAGIFDKDRVRNLRNMLARQRGPHRVQEAMFLMVLSTQLLHALFVQRDHSFLHC